MAVQDLTSVSAHSFFTEHFPAFLAGSEERSPKGAFVFELHGGESGSWTLDLRDLTPRGSVGASADADCVISLSDQDLASVLRREEDLEELYYRQRVQVRGDLQKAAGLLPLFSSVTAPSVPGLETLLAPYPASAFLQRHWPDRHLVVPGDERRLRALRAAVPLRDVHELLACWRGPVRVFPPGAADQLSPLVAPAAAAKLYARGFTLVFDSVDLQFADLHAWLEAVQTDLALPPTVWGRSMIYATPPGSGFNLHFDENANFAIQVVGAKRWRMALNPAAPDPTVGYRMGGYVHPDLTLQLASPLPERMPDDGFEVTLRSGGMLFVPRGCWHQTTAIEESLSLNFTFDQPCWADVLTTAIRSRLIREAGWRKLATGVGSGNPEQAAAAADHAEQLLKQLAAGLDGINGTALLSGLRPRVTTVDPIDMTRDWVSALSHLGLPDQQPETDPAGQSTIGMLLFERLTQGFENPSGVEGICQFDLEGPGGGAFHLIVSGQNMNYAEGRAENPSARVRMAASVARELALGENLDFRDQFNFDLIDADGDLELLGMLAQMTKLPNPDAGVRFTAAEQNAVRIPRMAEPRRLSRPSAGEVARAIEDGIPLIVEGGLEDWGEAVGWTFETLRTQFGNVAVKSNIGMTTLGEFLDTLDSFDGDVTPYTIGSTAPDELSGFFPPPPYFDAASFGPAQLWLGSGAGRISTLLHRDSGDAFLGQLIGRKRFKMYSPDQTPYMYVFKSYNRDQPCWVNPWEPDFTRFPLFQHAVATEFVLSPGELLIIPRGWYHTVMALDTTMSVGFHREPVSDFGRVLGQEKDALR